MRELLVVIAELRRHATAMKSMIVVAPGGVANLRERLYELEAAIYAMERAAVDASTPP